MGAEPLPLGAHWHLLRGKSARGGRPPLSQAGEAADPSARSFAEGKPDTLSRRCGGGMRLSPSSRLLGSRQTSLPIRSGSPLPGQQRLRNAPWPARVRNLGRRNFPEARRDAGSRRPAAPARRREGGEGCTDFSQVLTIPGGGFLRCHQAGNPSP